jgi:hypothetical protein
MELATGIDVWKERLGSNAWGSLVAVAGRLYVTSLAGETIVLAASPKFELLARSPLDERVRASIAVSDGELFIRTYKHLWCISDRRRSGEW